VHERRASPGFEDFGAFEAGCVREGACLPVTHAPVRREGHRGTCESQAGRVARRRLNFRSVHREERRGGARDAPPTRPMARNPHAPNKIRRQDSATAIRRLQGTEQAVALYVPGKSPSSASHSAAPTLARRGGSRR
jgi:hypothetical protein